MKNNILCSIKDTNVQVNSSGIPVTPLVLGIDFNNNISVVTVGKISNITNLNQYPLSGVTISWEQISPGFMKINHITGLSVGEVYNIRLVVYGDEN